MKRIIFFCILIFCIAINAKSQKTCKTDKVLPKITVIPAADPVAIPTRGWTYNNAESIEFDSTNFYNNWYIPASGWHSLTDCYYTNDTNYWKLNNGILELKLDSVPNGTFNYTTAYLRNENIYNHYGYYEIRMKMPMDNALVSSFWNVYGGWDYTYREIDVAEYFTTGLLFNVYHDTNFYGGVLHVDTSFIDSSQFFIYGCEWLPKEYNFYINNYFVGSFNYDDDCVEQDFENIHIWKLWIVDHLGYFATSPFPKVLEADYIRIYSLNTDNIDGDFYDNISDYDYGVWKTVHFGDTYSGDATFDDNQRHAIRATDSFTLGAGFEVELGTEFEAIIYKN